MINVHKNSHNNVHENTYNNIHENTHNNVHENTHNNVHENTYNNVHGNTHNNVHENAYNNIHENTHNNVHENTHNNVHVRSVLEKCLCCLPSQNFQAVRVAKILPLSLLIRKIHYFKTKKFEIEFSFQKLPKAIFGLEVKWWVVQYM